MLLSAEPYGKQADKRKKEVADLESKVQYIHVGSAIISDMTWIYFLC